MADETKKPTEHPTGPHTVKAGMLDALLGNRGSNGELLFDGKPALVEDLPDEEDDEDDR